jgi:NAD(P)-dependent dehydrogenase (short-subunit alcohol dehydrogenase family)
MSIALITGGNKGLGRATARRLAALGHTVYIGARDAERGQSAARELGVPWLQLDVTDDASVDAAAAELTRREGKLDILVNNAGVGGRDVKVDDLTADDLREAYEVNVFGLMRVTHAFLPLLHRSAAAVIVNVSSRLGAFGAMTDPDSFQYPYFTPVYGSSKSAVNMLTVQLAKELPQMRVNAVEPGLTATDLHGLSGPGVQTPDEGAAYIAAMATVPPDGPTGTFSYDTPLPW